MTFGNFILLLRERLQDMRQANASLISLPSEDGIRWTASNLYSIANLSIMETIRLVTIFSTSPTMKQLTDVNGTITKSTVDITSGVGVLPTDAQIVLEGSISSVPYVYITPNKYIFYLTSTVQPLSEGTFFTVLFDTTSSSRKIYCLPTTASGTMLLTYTLAKSDYTNTDFSVSIPLRNLDDLLLDVAERECRDREHNWERSKILDIRIMSKLGINLGGQ